ncbi:receptor-transporting protein 3-like [Alligator mississippiensis]|nr:receptor-transporting protein 3-like [Alligator mississippiensis]
MELWERKFTLKMALRVPGHSWSLTQEDNLNPWSLPYGWHQFQQKKCFARFQCSSCPNCWPSAQVLVTFHMHLDARERRGRVKMRPFGQKCKRCWGRKFEKPKFSEKNVERILDNVVLTIQEKLYRQPVANRHLLEPLVEDYVEGPHDTARCEACALGICYLRDLAPQSQPSAPPYHFVATASRAVTSPSGPQAQWVADTRDGTEAMNYAVVIVIVLLMLAALYFRN